LRNVRHLDVAHNELTAPLPELLGDLTSLTYPSTGINSFLPGPIPSFVESLTNLRELSMKGNEVTGEVPTWIGSLTALQLLDLDSNELVGPVPEQLALLTSLDHLLLNRNRLSGELPLNLDRLRDLSKKPALQIPFRQRKSGLSFRLSSPLLPLYLFQMFSCSTTTISSALPTSFATCHLM